MCICIYAYSWQYNCNRVWYKAQFIWRMNNNILFISFSRLTRYFCEIFSGSFCWIRIECVRVECFGWICILPLCWRVIVWILRLTLSFEREIGRKTFEVRKKFDKHNGENFEFFKTVKFNSNSTNYKSALKIINIVSLAQCYCYSISLP